MLWLIKLSLKLTLLVCFRLVFWGTVVWNWPYARSGPFIHSSTLKKPALSPWRRVYFCDTLEYLLNQTGLWTWHNLQQIAFVSITNMTWLPVQCSRIFPLLINSDSWMQCSTNALGFRYLSDPAVLPSSTFVHDRRHSRCTSRMKDLYYIQPL